MSNKYEKAFPTGTLVQHIDGRDEYLSGEDFGMTLRDYFAAKAMQGMLAYSSLEEIPTEAYKMADAMMVAKEAEE